MSPQELLKETQRTAGDPNLTTWHTLLVEKGKEAAGTAKVCTLIGFFFLLLFLLLKNYLPSRP